MSPYYRWYDWGTAKIDLATQTEGTLPEVSLPPGTQIAYLQSVQFSDDETPAGAVDGVNKIFTWANAPSPPSSLMVFLNGVKQSLGGDYTQAGAATTMNTAPPVGSVITGSYRY
jgi:hypothetical protein